ncbi:hypothetical protein ACGFYQ_18020 [Streptomyces sp. NPDC048258]|uniref:hypothetical protein n=1 Tax=Streptomyces sp. NPDC048258 TaxID=3365527 RepID=UPI00371A749D
MRSTLSSPCASSASFRQPGSPAARLTGHDLLLVLIKLAESQDPLTTLDTFFTTTQAPHPNPGERSSHVPAPA